MNSLSHLLNAAGLMFKSEGYASPNTMFMHEFVLDISTWSMYLLELLSVFIIVFTTIVAFYQLFRRNGYARIYLLHGQSIGLTFKLGAEIIRTVTAADLLDIFEVFLLIVIKACIVLLIERELRSVENEGGEGEDILHIHHHVHEGSTGNKLFSVIEKHRQQKADSKTKRPSVFRPIPDSGTASDSAAGSTSSDSEN